MAERRMFAKTIIDSDAFIDMPLSTQALYFHLSMRADDDGFINNPKKIQRMVGCGEDDLKLLIAKRFIIPFESGIVVIKHWKIHNYIRNDRYKPTVYVEEKEQLTVKENGAYSFGIPSGIPSGIPKDNQTVYQTETQYRVGKDREGKVSIGEREGRKKQGNQAPAPAEEELFQIYGKYNNVRLSADDLETLKTEFPADWEKRIERLSSYMARSGKSYEDHLATIEHWAEEDREKAQKDGSFGNSSFNTDSFFEAALNRSYSDPPKTAGNDDGIRERCEELKQRLKQKEGDPA